MKEMFRNGNFAHETRSEKNSTVLTRGSPHKHQSDLKHGKYQGLVVQGGANTVPAHS